MDDAFDLQREPPGAAWLRRNWNQLRAFEFEWVAASEDRIVAHDTDLERVMAVVMGQELTNQVTYAFVPEFTQETG
jgi:hypothetical protein